MKACSAQLEKRSTKEHWLEVFNRVAQQCFLCYFCLLTSFLLSPLPSFFCNMLNLDFLFSVMPLCSFFCVFCLSPCPNTSVALCLSAAPSAWLLWLQCLWLLHLLLLWSSWPHRSPWPASWPECRRAVSSRKQTETYTYVVYLYVPLKLEM